MQVTTNLIFDGIVTLKYNFFFKRYLEKSIYLKYNYIISLIGIRLYIYIYIYIQASEHAHERFFYFFG